MCNCFNMCLMKLFKIKNEINNNDELSSFSQNCLRLRKHN
jgi:hypothetical protein